MGKQYIAFNGSGLDSDMSEEYINPGDSKVDTSSSATYTGRKNIVPASDDGGRIESSPGTDQILHTLSISASIDSSLVLGYATDDENDKIYYFLQGKDNDGSNLNSILEFDPLGDDDSTAFTKVIWEDSALEFEEDRIIKGATVVDGWIYYNGYSYGLKKVNITLAKNYTDYSAWSSTGTYAIGADVRTRDGRIYDNLTGAAGTDPRGDSTNWAVVADTYAYPCDSSGDLEALSLDRVHIPPTSPITYAYDSDTSREINNLRGKLFQFTYRYKYRDHGYSRTAPISTITLPEDEESIEGEVENAVTTNNHLDLTFQNGDLGVVEWVELFVREGNTGTWYYVKRFEDGEETYAFYNDVALEAMDDSEIDTMADAIPKEANAETYISENRMLTAGNTEGYDNITLDVALTAGFDEVTIVTTGGLLDEFAIDEEVSYDGAYYGKFNVDDVATDTEAGDVVKIYIVSSNPTYTIDTEFVFVNTNGVGSEETDFRDECETAIINAGVGGVTVGHTDDITGITVNNGDFWLSILDKGDTQWDDTNSYINSYEPTTGTPNKWTGFKTGATHKFGIQYYDEQMRPFAAMTSSDAEEYVPTVPEEKGGAAGTGEYKWRTSIGWAISHAPPTDAAYWQWLYAGNSNISNFWTYIVNSSDGAKNTTDDYDTAGTDYTCLDISPLNNAQTVYPNSELSYTYTAGDRARILTQASDTNDTYGNLVNTADISDVEIIAYDSTYERLVLPYDSDKYKAGNSSLIEIYRPKSTSQETVYYTIGPVYETYTSGSTLYHRGATQDQTATDGSADAEGTLTRGDVYFITRAFSEALIGDGTPPAASINSIYLVESPSYSDFYTSNSYDYGKINVESDLGETYLNDIRWSNVYIQDTYINGLCTYDALDGYISLPNRNGDIQAIEQLGDMLRVYQEDRTTAVWIGRSETIDTSGQPTLSRSTSVLGSQRELALEYGTLNPESVTKTDKYIYGFDVQNGVFWRDSVNGLYPISGKETATGNDYKMEHYFYDKSKALLESGTSNVDVITEWDGKYKLLFVTFKDGNTSGNSETLAFHEPTNRWYAFYDFYGTAEDETQYTEFTGTTDLSTLSGSTTYTYYDSDGTFSIRKIVRDSKYCVDMTLSYVGFDGTEGTDWINLFRHTGQTAVYRFGLRGGEFVVDGTITGTGFSGTVDVDWENIHSVSTPSGTGEFREGCRDGAYVIDEALTSTAFDGTENTDWEEIESHTTSATTYAFPVSHPDCYMRYKNFFYSFLNGTLYKHHSTTANRATFYGHKRDVIVDVVTNENPQLVKVFEAIGLHTNGDWTVDEAKIEADTTYTNGMLSELGSARFGDIEGIQRAAFLRNKYTSSSTASTTDLYNGEKLRGRTMHIILKNTATSETKLFAVEVIYEDSTK